MKEDNYRTLKNLIRRERSFARQEKSESTTYLLLYFFLHKYMSDTLIKYFKTLNLSPDDVYANAKSYESRALDDLGFFITDKSAYFDNIFKEDNIDFYRSFIKYSINNIVFDDDDVYGLCFGIIRQALSDSGLIDYTQNLIISDCLRYIARFSIDDEKFTYQQVFSIVPSLRMFRIRQNPGYISDLLSHVISSQKTEIENAYDPFLNDSGVLMNLSEVSDIGALYGKEINELEYHYSIMNAIINGFKPSQINFFNQLAVDSVTVEGKLFDVIASKVPNTRYNYSNQKLEYVSGSADKSMELKNDILSKIEKNDLKADKKLLQALDTFIDEVKSADTPQTVEFEGEYLPLNGSEYLFIINMLNSLTPDGLMAISISQNFLFKKSLTLLRKFLTYENNYIDAIISIPEGLGRTVRPEVIIVFKKNKTTDDIVFIDISKQYSTKRAKNTISGLFRTNLLLSDECVNRIVEIYTRRERKEKMSEIVTLDNLEKNDFNLSVSRYVDTFEGEFVSIDELVNEKKELTSKIAVLNKKIDMMMDDLGIHLK